MKCARTKVIVCNFAASVAAEAEAGIAKLNKFKISVSQEIPMLSFRCFKSQLKGIARLLARRKL